MTNWLGEICQKEISVNDTILDLGCGIMQGTDNLMAKSILGVDLWDTYLNHIKSLHPTCRINMDETDRFMDGSYDVVLCLDVVEHLDKKLAIKILDECERICRKKAIIYTPNEFKDNDQPVNGAWGMGNNIHQKHLCLIGRNELKVRGYNVTNPMGEGWLGILTK